MNDNYMVENGKIVNIRQYVAAQDRQVKYKMSVADRRALEKTFDKRVKELQETRSLSNIVEVTDDDITIPGVSDQELAKYRTTVIEYGRDLSGQMNFDNRAGYTRDSLLKSFMMFKGWIPKQVSVRTLDIRKNLQRDEWEYGRTRLFVETWANLGFKGIGKMRDILQGNEKGLGWIKASTKKFLFDNNTMKVPHMGWNDVSLMKPDSKLFYNMPDDPCFYFVHSYYILCNDYNDVLTILKSKL
jgi:hypothetical protein